MSYPKRKYRKGYTIFGMDELLWNHLNRGRWVYLRGKVKHPGIILHMTLVTVKHLMDAHLLCEAIDQHQEWSRGEWRKPYSEGVTSSEMRK